MGAWKMDGRVREEAGSRLKHWRERWVAPRRATNRLVIAVHGSLFRLGPQWKPVPALDGLSLCFITCAIDAEEKAFCRERRA
jgi:hypothetical protein